MILAQMMRTGSESAKRGFYDDIPSKGLMMTHAKGFELAHVVLGLVTWLLLMAVLVALVRYLWFKGDKERKGR